AALRAIIDDYYFNFIPYFVNLFSSLFTFIAVIFFTSKLASDSEIIAILSSGVSFKRLLVPYIISSIILGIFSFVLINWVIPPANEKRLAFEEQYIRVRYRYKDKNIHKQIHPGTFVYMESYNNLYNIGYKFSMEKFEDGKLKSKLLSDMIQWDTTINKWKISHYVNREIFDSIEILTKGRRIDTVLNMTPDEFYRRNNAVEAMNYNELNDFIDDEIRIGSDNVVLWKIEKNKRFAFPFSTIILTIIGLSLSSRKRRGGIGLNIGVGIFLAFSYVMFMQISTVMATNASVSPIFAVWIPNLFFGLIALGLYFRAAS
ncbi:MAG: LptF/LptG family permease, partial [Salinivirgaceae bacterium]|nr:LptF/LptG family permease [Salinivirgaceae bacterium]